MNRCLITGGSGFVGKYLFEHLSKNNEVILSSRTNQDRFLHLDLKNYEESKQILLDYKFDKIFHLGFQSSVHISFEQPFDTINDNIVTSINLLKICQQQKNIKIVIAGTSEIYKSSEYALKESSDTDPKNPYSISKLAIDQFCRLLSKHIGLNVTTLRLFNHTGAGQGSRFVLSSFCQQLAKIKLGLQFPIIKTGNLDIKRDFSDVRDVVRAYEMVSNSDNLYGEVFNVCSGNAYLIRDLLNQLIQISGVEVKIEQDPNLIRKFDNPIYYGSYGKINKRFGWKPEISINKTLEDMYNWWYQKLQNDYQMEAK